VHLSSRGEACRTWLAGEIKTFLYRSFTTKYEAKKARRDGKDKECPKSDVMRLAIFEHSSCVRPPWSVSVGSLGLECSAEVGPVSSCYTSWFVSEKLSSVVTIFLLNVLLHLTSAMSMKNMPSLGSKPHCDFLTGRPTDPN